MWIKFTHVEERFFDNYIAYSQDEFINLVMTIADVLKIKDYPSVVFYDNLRSIAHCSMSISKDRRNGYWELGIRSEVLDGITYTQAQIYEIIKHELAHYIANSRYNEDCGHDNRWAEVAIEFGCTPSPYLPFIMYEVNVAYSLVERKNKNSPYALTCSQCNEVLFKGAKFGAFQLFLISINGLPLSRGKLESKTSCCNGYYDFYSNVKYLLKDLKNEKQLLEFQNTLEKILNPS